MFTRTTQLLLVTLCILISQSLYSQQNIVLGELEHDGEIRTYRLFIPSNYSDNEVLPLVLNLHGFGSNSFQQEWYSTMNFVADTARFFVCSPDGINNAWNVGWTFGSQADDVGFISSLIDEISNNYNVNTKKVYSCGMSNGGFMSYRLACELNDKIAAVASVTGSMVPEYIPQCNPGRPVPVMQVHGTNDPTVPYEGSSLLNVNIDSLIQFWVTNNECQLTADTSIVPDINMSDMCTAIRIDYNNCRESSKVSFYKIENGGHTWPSGTIDIGITNRDFNASIEIWNFFKQYELETISAVNYDNLDLKIELFPNPASDFITVNIPDATELKRYEIISLEGQLISKGVLNNNLNKIDIYHLKSSAYIFIMKSKSKINSKLFIKK